MFTVRGGLGEGASVDVGSLDASIEELDQAVKDVCDSVMARAADRARTDHVFVSRTGTLEGSVEPVRTTGSFASGTIETGIEATADYTTYVIDKTGDDFLTRAVESEMSDLESGLEARLQLIFDRM